MDRNQVALTVLAIYAVTSNQLIRRFDFGYGRVPLQTGQVVTVNAGPLRIDLSAGRMK
jgi:hypothetical protein